MSDVALRELSETFTEAMLAASPEMATNMGDHRFDDRLSDISPAGREQQQQLFAGVRARLAEIDPARLTESEQITHQALAVISANGLALARHELHHIAVDQLYGPQIAMPLLIMAQPVQSKRAALALGARFSQAIPNYIDAYIANLSEGMACQRTAPAHIVQRVIHQVRGMLAVAPESSAFMAHAAKAPASSQDTLLMAIREQIYPAYQRLLDYLEQDYQPHARPEPGLWSIPGGDAAYADLVAVITQSAHTPQEIHMIGLEALDGIIAEMRALGVEHLRQHVARLQSDPAQAFSTRAQLLAEARRLHQKAWERLPRLFTRLPRTPCRVRPIEGFREQECLAAFYYPLSAEGKRPGTYYVNTYLPETRPRYNLPALTLHEAVPGHHLQIALQTEAEGIPRLRKLALENHIDALEAFTEGWGLYSERLGTALDMYATDADYFGMLSYQAWRAARLVVDTGIHALRWSRAQAIEFFRDYVGLPENEIANEIDRYITWPGQALAYTMGQRHIERLRALAEDELGAAFDPRAFHDELLRHGAVPLSVASDIIQRWMQAQKSGHGQPEAGIAAAS